MNESFIETQPIILILIYTLKTLFAECSLWDGSFSKTKGGENIPDTGSYIVAGLCWQTAASQFWIFRPLIASPTTYRSLEPNCSSRMQPMKLETSPLLWCSSERNVGPNTTWALRGGKVTYVNNKDDFILIKRFMLFYPGFQKKISCSHQGCFFKWKVQLIL